jgi:hypothetical protein
MNLRVKPKGTGDKGTLQPTLGAEERVRRPEGRYLIANKTHEVRTLKEGGRAAVTACDQLSELN